MTDVKDETEQEQSVADPEGTNDGDAPAEEAKAPKVVKQPHACYCSTFEVGNYEDGDDGDVFTTGCNQTTNGTFAQGHDARLVSFLVDGYLDGYKIRQAAPGGVGFISYATPAEAARTASDALGNKAANATANGVAKVKAKKEKAAAREQAKAEKAAAKAKAAADKAAAKANAPKATGAEVVAGSAEGDPVEAPEGTTKIKVGRWEYDAVIDPETEVATYTDGKGEQVEVERDGYRVLVEA